MIAHHTVNGCSLRPGDMLGSGTISGEDAKKNSGSMLELSWNGKFPMNLDGIKRSFLEDGDTMTITGGAKLPDGTFIGMGNVVTTVLKNNN